MEENVGKYAIAYFWAGIWSALGDILVGYWRADASTPGVPEGLVRFLTGSESLGVLVALFIVAEVLTVGWRDYDLAEDCPRTAKGRGRQVGCILCLAAVLLIGCLYAWVLIARGGWWGAAYPVIHALLLWNLYRALYPKNIPDMPENE